MNRAWNSRREDRRRGLLNIFVRIILWRRKTAINFDAVTSKDVLIDLLTATIVDTTSLFHSMHIIIFVHNHIPLLLLTHLCVVCVSFCCPNTSHSSSSPYIPILLITSFVYSSVCFNPLFELIAAVWVGLFFNILLSCRRPRDDVVGAVCERQARAGASTACSGSCGHQAGADRRCRFRVGSTYYFCVTQMYFCEFWWFYNV